MDVYGSSGDYLASGIDGAEVFVHGDAQDQLAQIMKDGKLVVYGSVGQTSSREEGRGRLRAGQRHGAALINAVGKLRVVINGTCLDYLAESFIAGDPLNGGGFAILNGISLNDQGKSLSWECLPGRQLVFAGFRWSDLHPRPAHKGLRGTTQWRGVCPGQRA